MDKYMRKSNIEKSIMTEEKLNSKKTADRLVMDELLEMGFSYSSIGTHYLHDIIVASTQFKLEDFENVTKFCEKAAKIVCKKYNIKEMYCYKSITYSINKAFEDGNIEYLLNTFKGSYDKDRMNVSKNEFIMVVRPKIIAALEEQETKSNTHLRSVIQGTVEKITDYALLKSISDIVLSLASGTA